MCAAEPFQRFPCGRESIRLYNNSVCFRIIYVASILPGIAQMPKVQAAVKGRFPEGTSFGAGLLPDEAVAIGATTQAFLLQVPAESFRCGLALFVFTATTITTMCYR